MNKKNYVFVPKPHMKLHIACVNKNADMILECMRNPKSVPFSTEIGRKALNTIINFLHTPHFNIQQMLEFVSLLLDRAKEAKYVFGKKDILRIYELMVEHCVKIDIDLYAKFYRYTRVNPSLICKSKSSETLEESYLSVCILSCDADKVIWLLKNTNVDVNLPCIRFFKNREKNIYDKQVEMTPFDFCHLCIIKVDPDKNELSSQLNDLYARCYTIYMRSMDKCTENQTRKVLSMEEFINCIKPKKPTKNQLLNLIMNAIMDHPTFRLPKYLKQLYISRKYKIYDNSKVPLYMYIIYFRKVIEERRDQMIFTKQIIKIMSDRRIKRDPASLLVMVTSIGEYIDFRKEREDEYKKDDDEQKNLRRFFMIVSQLPMDILKVLCNRTYGVVSDNVSGNDIEKSIVILK